MTAGIWLEQMLHKMMERNPSFSLRSFAKLLETSPSTISRIISGERNLSFKLASKISEKMALPPQEQKTLFALVLKKRKVEIEEECEEEESVMNLTLDAFAAISDWYHYGICQLINCEGFIEDNKWIASVLEVSELEVKLAISRLLRLGILDRDSEDQLYRTSVSLFSTDGVTSPGLRKFHKQILEKAMISIDQDSLNERSVTSVTVAVNEDQIPKAMEEITKFRIKMAKLLSKGKQTRIYNLGINLIPVSKRIGDQQ